MGAYETTAFARRWLVAVSRSTAQTTVTVFEGARVIVGDGRTIDNATIVMQGDRLTQVGPAASIKAPAGATRVSLAGKTVMPAIVDTHVHTSTTEAELVNDLQQRARFGIGAALSMGLDGTDAAFIQRDKTVPTLARIYTAGRGITAPEKGRTEVPYWITTPEEGRKAVRELAAKRVDIIKIWVDDRDGKFPKLTPPLYTAVIDEAHKNQQRVTAHIFSLEDAKGLLKAGIDSFAHGIRDRDIDEETVALFKARPNVVLIPNMPDRGVAADYSWLKGSIPDGALQKIQAGGHRSAGGAEDLRHPGSQPREAVGGGGEDHRRHRRQYAVGAARGDGRHGGVGHDAGAGDCRRHEERRRVPAHPEHRHHRERQDRRLHRAGREPAAGHHEHDGRSRRCICAAPRCPAEGVRRGGTETTRGGTLVPPARRV